ncbi:MAG: hypothetical protein Ct9H300mP32_1880 [Verrucomicrobiota bacterium]|nr:MAG: hypothetical protein Ct9H300mP32_1880 [Verrucomicrobiota bacterium]
MSREINSSSSGPGGLGWFAHYQISMTKLEALKTAWAVIGAEIVCKFVQRNQPPSHKVSDARSEVDVKQCKKRAVRSRPRRMADLFDAGKGFRERESPPNRRDGHDITRKKSRPDVLLLGGFFGDECNQFLRLGMIPEGLN